MSRLYYRSMRYCIIEVYEIVDTLWGQERFTKKILTQYTHYINACEPMQQINAKHCTCICVIFVSITTLLS